MTEAPARGAFLERSWSEVVAAARRLEPAAVAAEYADLFIGIGKPEVFLYGSFYVAGSLHGIFTRAIPRSVRAEPVEMVLTNLGEPALRVGPDGTAVPVDNGGPGAVLYRGPMSVAGASTSEYLGFGFRGFPHIGAATQRFSFRVYAASTLEATMRMPQLWRGAHPLPKDHVFMVTRVRASFSRPVPVQIGGDLAGWKSEVEYNLCARPIDLLDWNGVRMVN